MRFLSLKITNLRCIESLSFQPGPYLNLISGENGSGKTSVLEAVSLACLGRSFHTNREKDLLRKDQNGLRVEAQIQGPQDEVFNIDVKKRGKLSKIYRDGQIVTSASALARMAPSVAVHSRVTELLINSPANRRALIDRTMFHVEPRYVASWKLYRRALKQRNELLRNNRTCGEAKFWHDVLNEHGSLIERDRKQLVQWVNQELKSIDHTGKFCNYLLRYAPGWKGSELLSEALDRTWAKDRQLGYTSSGVHRADLMLIDNTGQNVKNLSRGQIKFIIICLMVAFARFIGHSIGRKPILLVDDLAAELDDNLRSSLVEIICEIGSQVYFTAIREKDLPELVSLERTVLRMEK